MLNYALYACYRMSSIASQSPMVIVCTIPSNNCGQFLSFVDRSHAKLGKSVHSVGGVNLGVDLRPLWSLHWITFFRFASLAGTSSTSLWHGYASRE